MPTILQTRLHRRLVLFSIFLVSLILSPISFQPNYTDPKANAGNQVEIAETSIQQPVARLNDPAIASREEIPQEYLVASDRRLERLLKIPVLDSKGELLSIEQFAEGLQENWNDPIGGVYVPSLFALPIIQQPEGNDVFVSNKTGLVTQFRQAEHNGVTGLLAHNYLSGKDFYDLEIGQEIWLLYNDANPRSYQVSSIHRYQRLNHSRAADEFVDLTDQRRMTTREVFNRFYRGEPHLTFQTCLEGEGRLDWGLYFVVATPLDG